MNTERPIGIALMISDRVITDALTGEKSIIGTISQIRTRSFPFAVPRMTFFVALSNGQGNANFELKCSSEDDRNLVVMRFKGIIPFKNPTDVVEMAFQMQNIIFQKPGLYAVEFLCEDVPVLQRPLVVSLVTPPPPPMPPQKPQPSQT